MGLLRLPLYFSFHGRESGYRLSTSVYPMVLAQGITDSWFSVLYGMHYLV